MNISASKQMSPVEEELAAKLRPTSSVAWGKLHGDVSSQIEVEVELPDGVKTLPMSAVRALAYDSDLTVRRTAFEAELRTWEEHRVPLAASLNSIKGERLVLCERRGWDSPLSETLLDANIDRETLDAMISAAENAFPDFRRYFRAKAKATSGAAKLPFYDLFAPLGKDRVWSYPEACEFVSRQFHGYSSKLGEFADRAFRENWIDVDPRPGKRDGAFCAGLRRDESRILLNFKPAFGSVSTLAHELGHGYHNLCLADRTMMQRETPMTLAETASIFCETIITQAAIAEGDAEDQLAILEASLMRCGQTVVDITSRYYFESAVFEQRNKRELSADEFCGIMKEAQEKTYGDGLDSGLLHPYMWAAKPHYYGRSFYNFPYMYGLLFGVGLYKVYEQDPDGFRSKYDDLLSSTGLADAWTLGQRFGFDVRDEAFWAGSLEVIVRDIDRFEELVNQTTKG
jgi:pepF/M3 family oligoendopeptidase